MNRNMKYLVSLIVLIVIVVMLKVLPLWVTGLCVLSFGAGIFLGYKLFPRGGDDTKE